MGDLFDFGDGHGLVPAHRHINPRVFRQTETRPRNRLGGWVADTAKVGPDAFIAPMARVGWHGMVADGCAVRDQGRVLGYAMLAGKSNVFTDAVVDGHAVVEGRSTINGTSIVTDAAHVSGQSIVLGASYVGGTVTVRHAARVCNQRFVGAEIVTWMWEAGRPEEWTRPTPKWAPGRKPAKRIKKTNQSGPIKARVVDVEFPPQFQLPPSEAGLIDFGDRMGPVPAHRHWNIPKTSDGFWTFKRPLVPGGWVADTATAEPFTWVDYTAMVGGVAQVKDFAEVREQGRVIGRAVVQDSARVLQRAVVGGDAIVKDHVTLAYECQVHQGIWFGKQFLFETMMHMLPLQGGV